MNRKTVCTHCSEQIPHSAWICPACGGWVGEVTRHASTASGTRRVLT